MATEQKAPLGRVLVIGGCGFLGHHIVSLLHDRYHCTISVLDLRTTRNRHSSQDITYHDGDITSIESLLSIFNLVKPDVVVHTASPVAITGTNELFHKVNVGGTKCVVEACQKTGVKALVFTSSASIISDNTVDLVNADERWPVIPEKLQREYYSWTKAEAEAVVLDANRAPESPKLLTASIRPSGIFGPGDVQLIPNLLNVHYTDRTGFQLGDNNNLFDFTFVKNVAHAHLLCAAALLATSKLNTTPLDTERVDGEAFLITNGSPVPFWDFARAVWRAAGSTKGTEHVWVIGKDFGLGLAGLVEGLFWIVGKTPNLTRMKVNFSCMTRYFSIEKARSRLGYVPLVPLDEAIKITVKQFEEERVREGEKKGQ
ncbi:erg26, C-3 sterol dehydrogenase [Ciborinia camelliae]|nr:erg26, C-3 sterol dehydrogenase [Ciborinia camelliae]